MTGSWPLRDPLANRNSVHRLDNRGTPCSLGLLRVRKVLAELAIGDDLEVVTRDRFAPYEVPLWVEKNGLQLDSFKRSGFWIFSSTTFRIKKTVEVAAPRVKG